MREIKFRGKRIDNGDWLIGKSIRIIKGDYYIEELYEEKKSAFSFGWIGVIPESVGQFTGLNNIYEGDIIAWIDSDDRNRIDVVKFEFGKFYL